ncbi:MAG: EF-P lysine aminoacylase EpmA [Gammaproteobacteria bacterium]|jgi:lysyl-tRNA synthetase class 2|nr:EF-P lysine aminoacylase EpmA [Gammaproteobacteria bacterium]
MADEHADTWRPSASLAALRARAELLAGIRAFFRERGVLEVETPLLGNAAGTDPHLALLATRYQAGRGSAGRTLYLQTSPEFAMKRLVAAYGLPVYQVTKAFRDAERGRLHNPEFSLLEWYRPGWDHHALMDEVQALFERLLGIAGGTRIAYREAFGRAVGLDPLEAPVASLASRAEDLGLAPEADPERDDCLDFLFATVVQPSLSALPLAFVHDFPATQAALARVRPGEPPLAERFEAFLGGVEVANGYHELTDADEQLRRFDADLARRREMGLPETPLDGNLLAALRAGLPPCAGVACGLDRILLAAHGARTIDEVLTFPIERA